MRCGLQDSADLTVFNLLDIMMFFLTVPHWAVYTLVLLLHVCTLILIDIDIDIGQDISIRGSSSAVTKLSKARP